LIVGGHDHEPLKGDQAVAGGHHPHEKGSDRVDMTTIDDPVDTTINTGPAMMTTGNPRDTTTKTTARPSRTNNALNESEMPANTSDRIAKNRDIVAARRKQASHTRALDIALQVNLGIARGRKLLLGVATEMLHLVPVDIAHDHEVPKTLIDTSQALPQEPKRLIPEMTIAIVITALGSLMEGILATEMTIRRREIEKRDVGTRILTGTCQDEVVRQLMIEIEIGTGIVIVIEIEIETETDEGETAAGREAGAEDPGGSFVVQNTRAILKGLIG